MAGRERYQDESTTAEAHRAPVEAPSMLAQASHQLGAAGVLRKLIQRRGRRQEEPMALLKDQQRSHDRLLHDILEVEDATSGRSSKEVTAQDAAAPHRVIVGDMHHIEMAQGPVVAAGLLLLRFHGSDRPAVGELENVSGGFRPGPLRNATAAAAIRAAGYRVMDGAAHDVETGDYDHSKIAPDGQPRPP